MNIGKPTAFSQRGVNDFRHRLKEAVSVGNKESVVVVYRGSGFDIEVVGHSLESRQVAVTTPHDVGDSLSSNTRNAFESYVNAVYVPEVASNILQLTKLDEPLSAYEIHKVLVQGDQMQKDYILGEYFSGAWEYVFGSLVGDFSDPKNKELIDEAKKSIKTTIDDWEVWIGGPLTSEESEEVVYRFLGDFKRELLNRIPLEAPKNERPAALVDLEPLMPYADEVQFQKAMIDYGNRIESRTLSTFSFHVFEAVRMTKTVLQEEYFGLENVQEYMSVVRLYSEYLHSLSEDCKRQLQGLMHDLEDVNLSMEDRKAKNEELGILRFQLRELLDYGNLLESSMTRYNELQAYATPITAQDVKAGYNVRMQAYLRLVEQLILNAGGDEEKIQKLQNVGNEIATLYAKKSKQYEEAFPEANVSVDAESVKQEIRSLRDEFEGAIKSAFKREGLRVPSLKYRYEEAMIQALEHNQEWDIISKNLPIKFGDEKGQSANFQVEIIPHRHLPNLGEQLLKGDEGKKGVTSLDTTSKHAVNMAVTRLSIPDAEGESKTLFEAVRSGIVSAFGIASKEERKEANLQRGREQVQAAAQLSFERRMRENKVFQESVQGMMSAPNFPKDAIPVLDFGALDIPVQLASVSLVTPDIGRSWIQAPLKSITGVIKSVLGKTTKQFANDERLQLKEQVEVWKSLGGQPMEFAMEVKDATGGTRKVLVRIPAGKIKIRSFNFGVNEGALQGKFGVPSSWSLVSGWDMSDKINAESLDGPDGLLADVPKWLADPANKMRPDYQQKLTSIKMLVDQIHQMRADQSYKTQKNPYKFAVRVAALAHLLGYTDLFNCKSGKDRTGMMDVEIKYLFAYMNCHNGIVPDPFKDLTLDERGAITALAFEGGNREIQQYNTGLPGSKTKFGRVDALLERFIGPIARLHHQGLAAVVKD